MKQTTRTTYHPRRLLALTLAFLCLWMGTAGVSEHTDSLRNGTSHSPLRADSHATQSAASDTCAACEWTQGVQSGGAAAFAVSRAFDMLAPLTTFAAHDKTFGIPRLRSPRAPPALSS